MIFTFENASDEEETDRSMEETGILHSKPKNPMSKEQSQASSEITDSEFDDDEVQSPLANLRGYTSFLLRYIYS